MNRMKIFQRKKKFTKKQKNCFNLKDLTLTNLNTKHFYLIQILMIIIKQLKQILKILSSIRIKNKQLIGQIEEKEIQTPRKKNKKNTLVKINRNKLTQTNILSQTQELEAVQIGQIQKNHL